ncbi:MAG: hypothetical protein RRA94_11235, partial [Bacteroidota bacterium]|nr:hypothetical protein [Bacteroidota bacterium]
MVSMEKQNIHVRLRRGKERFEEIAPWRESLYFLLGGGTSFGCMDVHGGTKNAPTFPACSGTRAA